MAATRSCSRRAVLRLGLGRGAADELLLASQRVLPESSRFGFRLRPRASEDLAALAAAYARPARPAPGRPAWSVEVRAVAADVVVDGVIGVDRLAGVAPETLLDVVADQALGDVMVVHVGDLELASPRGPKGADHVEHARGHRGRPRSHNNVLGGIFGLLDDSHDLARVVQLRHSEVAQVVRVLHLGKQQTGTLWRRRSGAQRTQRSLPKMLSASMTTAGVVTDELRPPSPKASAMPPARSW